MDRMAPGVVTYNYADESQLTSREIAETISQSLSKKEPITLPYGLVYLMGIPFDILIKITGKDLPISTNRVKKFCTETYHKADKLFRNGFTPRFTNREGLKRMVKWQESEYKKEEEYHNV